MQKFILFILAMALIGSSTANAKSHHRGRAVFVVIKSKPTRAQVLAVAVKDGSYQIRRGDNLMDLAKGMSIDWEQILLSNEEMLKAKYEIICHGAKPAPQRGMYCNDGYNRPYSNTLQVGWRIKIPSQDVPNQIKTAVQNMRGNSIALVIDDTGSMGNDRREVGAFYTAAISQYGKKLAGIWLFSNGEVRKYAAGGVQFFNHGRYENTYGALKEASLTRPDAIVLVTDEHGDDWPAGGVQKGELPKVIAHCLPERGMFKCEPSLHALATVTGGTYVRHTMPTPVATAP